MSANVQDQIGWGFEQLGLTEYVIAHGKAIGLAGL